MTYKLVAGTQAEAQAVVDYYNEHISELSPDDAQAIAETYDRITARKLDGKAWMLGIIEDVSKKRADKQNIGYIIGVARNRLNKGWGTLESEEERILLDRCRERNIPLNTESIAEVYRMMGEYGALKTLLIIDKLDINDIVTKALSEL